MTFPNRGFWVRTGLLLVLAFVAIQFVPYGRDHVNPPVAAEPTWDSPETRALAKQACFDCHSNETEWPAYSQVAPVSWFIQHDVAEGRAVLNFSEWQRPQEEATEAAEEVLEGEMPLRTYQLMHAHARLSTADRDRLARGLARTLGGSTDEARRVDR
jgi:mono/diheme cytochrome c family protein